MKGRVELKGALALLLVLAVAAALLLAGLGDMPLTDRDEGEYAAAVASMRARGDWLVPTLNGKLYLEKPILVYWAMAGSQALLGDNEAAARLPSALAGFLLVLVVGLAAWRAGGRPSLGALAAAALAFSPLLVLVSRACLTDALLSLWTTLALLWVWWALEQAPGRGGKWWLLAWAALGLGFLTKGPVALAVVLPSAGIYALAQGRLARALKEARWLWGLVIFLVINLPWYGLVWFKLGDTFVDAFFVSQNLRRFSETLLGHGGGLFYYLPVLLIGAFPFAALALPELGRALGQNLRALRQKDPLAGLHMLSAISLLVVLVVFSIAATKQINYVLPALPFLALLAGCSLDRLSRGEIGGRLARPVFWGLLWLGGGLLVLALAAVPAGLPLFWEKIQASIRFDSSEYALPLAAPVMILWPLLAALLAGVAAYGATWAWRRGRGAAASWALAGGAALFCGVVFLGLLPQAAGSIQTPAKQLAREVERRVDTSADVVTYGLWKPSLIYYTERNLPRFHTDQLGELSKALAAGKPVYVLSRVRLRDRLLSSPGFVVLQERGGYLLGGNEAAARIWRGEAPPPVETKEPA
ncbi:MAG: glycosyltransferase family 39 protein [Desulfarculaceae bacterium]|nr:glycosyltransferase family 39 protein [Desulfarculaceae bacterium]MCF8072248.1 glycosyltransferase family 39 protein [Desulfarculaceae bacterium]MCF8100169.1 glycosyltransferase family 39 protein [Desulfarculaceae bacterium]MCF8117888.1 glycosyltransferase family 39 protein [Desulfarculaceae bacterium]